MDISFSKFNIFRNDKDKKTVIQSKNEVLAPLRKDTVSISNAHLNITEEDIRRAILNGNIDTAKSNFEKIKNGLRNKNFDKFVSETIKKFGINPNILKTGKYIEYDNIIKDQNGNISFYKDNNPVRKIHSHYLSENENQTIIEDGYEYDKENKCYIERTRIYDNDKLSGVEINFLEDKYKFKYKSIYYILDEKGNVNISHEEFEDIWDLRNELDETIPKFTENSQLKPVDPKLKLPEYLYHITTKENYLKMLSDKKIKSSKNRDLQGLYCIDAQNFINQWNENEAWKGNLKENLVFTQVAKNKNSKEIVVLRIPTEKINHNDIKVRTEEDFFYSQKIQRASLKGFKMPKCVTEGYNWDIGITNFYSDKSIEFIINNDINIEDTEIVYSDKLSKNTINNIISSIT